MVRFSVADGKLAYSLLWHLLSACLPVSDGPDNGIPVCTHLIIPLWDG